MTPLDEELNFPLNDDQYIPGRTKFGLRAKFTLLIAFKMDLCESQDSFLSLIRV